MHAQSLSHDRFLATPWMLAHQAPLSMGFPRQEYWSGVLFPALRDHPDRPRGRTPVPYLGRRVPYRCVAWEAVEPLKQTVLLCFLQGGKEEGEHCGRDVFGWEYKCGKGSAPRSV